MFKQSLGAVVALGLFVGTASAATISYNVSFTDPVPNNTPGTVYSLSQFDPSLGTLTSVVLEVSGGISAGVTGENDSAVAGNLTASLTGNLQVAGPGGINLAVIFSDSEGPIPVDATDGTPDSGGDFVDFGILSDTGADSGFLSSGFTPFIGTGSFDVTVSNDGGFNISGVTDSSLGVAGFESSGLVTVTYDYTPNGPPPEVVPAPAALAFIGAGMLALGAVRRRSK